MMSISKITLPAALERCGLGRQLRVSIRQLQHLCLWLVFGLLAILGSHLAPANGRGLVTCPTGQTLKTVSLTKVCVDCTACGPGKEPSSSCRPDMDTVCLPCPDGTFSDVTSSSRRCQVCTSRRCFSRNPFLPSRQRNCTAKQDTTCDECGEGKYWSNDTQKCEHCDTCELHEEEVQACTYYTKRRCVPMRTRLTTPPQGSTELSFPSLVPTIISTSSTQSDQQSKGHASATESPERTVNSSTVSSPPKDSSKESVTQQPIPTATKSPAKARGDSQEIVIGVTITVALIILFAAIFAYYYRKHKSCLQQNDCSEEEAPKTGETTRAAQEDRDEEHETSGTQKTGVPQSQDLEIDGFLPEEAVHRLSILQHTHAAFRNRICLLLSRPDSNGKDWRSLLPVLDLSSDEDFNPWLSNSTANSTKPVETLLGKVSGKTVEEFDASLGKAGLKDAVDYIWRAQTFEATEGNPLPAAPAQPASDSS